MRASIGLAVAVVGLAVGVARAADENPFAGKWATDKVATVDAPEQVSFLKRTIAGAASGGSSGGGIGNTTAPQPGATGFPNAGQAGPQRGPQAGPQRGPQAGPQRGPQAGPQRGAVTVATVSEDDEPPITLVFKVDGKGNLTGTVSEITISPVYALKNLKVEKGVVNGKKINFETSEKTEAVSNTTRWVGELTDERTITMTRLTKGGNPIDGNSIVFHRGK